MRFLRPFAILDSFSCNKLNVIQIQYLNGIQITFNFASISFAFDIILLICVQFDLVKCNVSRVMQWCDEKNHEIKFNSIQFCLGLSFELGEKDMKFWYPTCWNSNSLSEILIYLAQNLFCFNAYDYECLWLNMYIHDKNNVIPRWNLHLIQFCLWCNIVMCIHDPFIN